LRGEVIIVNGATVRWRECRKKEIKEEEREGGR
jgi:hypothetical protein